MAISNKAAVGTSASVTAGTASTPTISPYDNTHTVIVYNEDSTNTLYVGFTDGASISATDAIFVPTQSSITLAIGTLSQRPADGVLKFDCSAGSITARVTYINGLQS